MQFTVDIPGSWMNKIKKQAIEEGITKRAVSKTIPCSLPPGNSFRKRIIPFVKGRRFLSSKKSKKKRPVERVLIFLRSINKNSI